MKARTVYLTINHPEKTGFVHLTPQVEDAVRKSGVREGIALINPKRHSVLLTRIPG